MASFLIGLHECRLLGSFTQPGWRRGTWPVSSGRLALLFAQSIDGAHCLDGQSVECERRLTNLGLEDACGLGQQDLAGLEIGKLLDSLGAQLSALAASTGSPETKAMAVGPLRSSARKSRPTSLAARRASVFFATA